ncbi:hypothetical protein [Methanoregula sp.]
MCRSKWGVSPLPGYEKKIARRLVKYCDLAMTFTCGIFGLFF